MNSGKSHTAKNPKESMLAKPFEKLRRGFDFKKLEKNAGVEKNSVIASVLVQVNLTRAGCIIVCL